MIVVLILCLAQPLAAIKCFRDIETFAAEDCPACYYFCRSKDAEAELRRCESGQVYSHEFSTCVPGSASRTKRNTGDSDLDTLEVLKLPSLSSEHADLGKLYNAKRQQFTQHRIWSTSEIMSNRKETIKEYSSVDVVTSDTYNERKAHLNIEASLSIGFLSGLIEVSGSAKYLSDVQDSYKYSQVSLTYEATTKAQTMPLDVPPTVSMDKFCEEANTKDGATHVVTSRVLGARAFLTFKQEVSKYENVQNIGGKLSITIKKIPGFKISGSGYVDINETEVKNIENLSVNYHGDIGLTRPPTTYLDAIGAFNEIKDTVPTANAVIEYELTPLQYFCKQQNKVFKPVEKDLVNALIHVLMELRDLKLLIAKLENSEPSERLLMIKDALNSFSTELANFETQYKADTVKALIDLRASTATGSEAIMKLLSRYQDSAFQKGRATLFLNNRKKELETIQLVLHLAKTPKYAVVDMSSSRENLCILYKRFILEYKLAVIPPNLKKVVTNYLETKTVSDEGDAWFNSFQKVGNAGKRLRNMDTFVQANYGNDYDSTCYVVVIAERQNDTDNYLSIVFREAFGDARIEYLSTDFVAPPPPPKPVCISRYYGFEVEKVYVNNSLVTDMYFDVKNDDGTKKFSFTFKNSGSRDVEAVELSDGTEIESYTEYTILSRYVVRSDRFQTILGKEVRPGYSPDSTATKCYTAPSTPVQDLKIANIEPTAFKVSFAEPAEISSKSEVDTNKKYVIEVLPEGEDVNNAILMYSNDIIESPGSLVKNLKPATTYKISAYLQAPRSSSYPETVTIATTFDSLPIPEVQTVYENKADVVFKGSYMKVPSVMVIKQLIFEFWETDSQHQKVGESKKIVTEVNSSGSKDISAVLSPLEEGKSYKTHAYLKVNFNSYDMEVETILSAEISFAAAFSGSATDRMQKQIDQYEEELNQASTNLNQKLEDERKALADLKQQLENLVTEKASEFEESALGKVDTYEKRLPGFIRSACLKHNKMFHKQRQVFTKSSISSAHQCTNISGYSYDAVSFNLNLGTCVGYQSESGKYIYDDGLTDTLNKKCYDALNATPDKWESCIKTGTYANGSNLDSSSGTMSSIYDCAAWCWNTKSCVGVLFDNSKKCTLKSSIGSTSSNSQNSLLDLTCLSN